MARPSSSSPARAALGAALALLLLGGPACDEDLRTQAAEIDLEADVLDFGTVTVGYYAERVLAVRATSAVPASLRVEVTGPDADRFRVTAPDRVSVLTEVLVAFRPLEARVHEARLVLRACDQCAPHEVVLSGSGRWALLQTWPPTLDFGILGVGESETRTVSLQNLGEEALEVESVVLVDGGGGGAAVYAIEGASAPLTVPGQGEHDLTVRFSPDREATFAARLVWRAPTTARGMGEVALLGRGEAEAELGAPETLSFGGQMVGVPTTRPLRVENVGGANLLLEEAAIRSGAGFEVDTEMLPWSLAPGSHLDLQVTWTPQALGTQTGALTLTSDDPDAAETVVALQGEGTGPLPCTLAVSPQGIDFGPTVRGLEYRRTAFVTNVSGSHACAFESVTLAETSDPAFSLTEGAATAPFELGPGEARRLEVTLTAPGASAQGAVALNTENPSDRRTVPMTARDGDLTAVPPHVDFGVADAACARTSRPVCIYDLSGTGDTLASVTTRSSTGDATFGWTGFDAGAPLPGRGRLCGELTFSGPDGSRGEAAIELTFASGRSVVVTAEGHIEARPLHTERFIQHTNPKIDVLFVVERQWDAFVDNLSAGLGGFLAAAAAAGRDWRIGATATHCEYLGRCGMLAMAPSSGYQVVTPALDDPEAVLGELLWATQSDFVPAPGDFEGLWTAFVAVAAEDPRAGVLLRPGAELAVVFQSVHDDQSQQDVDYYLHWFRALGGPSQRVRLHAFGADADAPVDGTGLTTCTGGAKVRPARRYSRAVRTLGGAFEDVCALENESAAASAAARLGEELFNYRRKFPLEGRPDPATLEASIETADGVVIDLQGRWYYDGAYNVLEIARGWAPEPGDTLVVQYRPLCG